MTTIRDEMSYSTPKKGNETIKKDEREIDSHTRRLNGQE